MAHVFQDPKQKAKLGEKKCPWTVRWRNEEGKPRSKKVGSKSMAEKYCRKIEGQQAAGLLKEESNTKWADFRIEYEAKILPRLAPKTLSVIKSMFDHFERLAKPRKMAAIKTRTVDAYITKRRMEQGKKKGSTVSPATVNRELRDLKAALRVAHDWKYLPEVPKVRMLKEPGKLVQYVTPDHFAAIYKACDVVSRPESQAFEPGDWWRAIIVFCYMTGWRVSEPLALRWEDLDLDKGEAITRHGDNKGNRDDVAHLHPVVVDHLRKLKDFGEVVFYWPHHDRTLWVDFGRIQEAAGIHLTCREDHEHTDACHVYGFHDLRRAFATLNAEMMTGDALQKIMRHKSYSTTQGYINMANQVNHAVEGLHVPDFLKKKRG